MFDEAGVLEFECNLKHMCAKHALLIEHITTIASTQLVEEEGNVEDILRKVMHIASTARDLEDVIMEYMGQFLLRDVADATSGQMRVEEADIKQFIWEYGHFVLAEEHYALYIGGEVHKLQNATEEKERKEITQKVVALSKFLYTTRTVRKKLLSGFLEKAALADVPSQVK